MKINSEYLLWGLIFVTCCAVLYGFRQIIFYVLLFAIWVVLLLVALIGSLQVLKIALNWFFEVDYIDRLVSWVKKKLG